MKASVTMIQKTKQMKTKIPLTLRVEGKQLYDNLTYENEHYVTEIISKLHRGM